MKAARRQSELTWVFGMSHGKTMSGLAPDFVSFRRSLIVRVPAYSPDFTCSQAAAAARPAPLGVVHAPSCRFVLQTCHSCAERTRSRRLVGVRDSIQTSGVPTSLRMSACPHSNLPASSSRSHQIATATGSELAISCPSCAHTLSQVAMRPLAARRVIPSRAVRATGRRA